MAKKQQQQQQLAFDWEHSELPPQPIQLAETTIGPTPKPPTAGDAAAHHPMPVADPLPEAIEKGAFGFEDEHTPIDPSPEEILALTRHHGERLVALLTQLRDVQEQLPSPGGGPRTLGLAAKERLQSASQGLLALYAEDFGEPAALRLKAWAEQEAGLARLATGTPFPLPGVGKVSSPGSPASSAPVGAVRNAPIASGVQPPASAAGLSLVPPLRHDAAKPPSASDTAAADSSPVVGSPHGKGTNNGGTMQTEITTNPQIETPKPTRAEKLDKLHETVGQALDKLASALEAGQSDTLKAWLRTMGRFHHYSLNNQMLIAWQRPDATHVAGFHAWKKFDRLVSKGEKGIMILAPVTKVVGKKTEADPQGKNVEKPIRAIVNTKVVYVFDVSQTHGEPLPELSTIKGDPAAFTPKIKDLIAQKGIELYFASNLPGGALGISEGGRIGVKQGLFPAEEFHVLAHELAHELLHRGDRRKETTKRSRELEAEAVAFVVCHAVGLDAEASSTDYIHLYRGDKEMLLESLQFIRRVSGEVLDALAPTAERLEEA